jgi:hypothetical protein
MMATKEDILEQIVEEYLIYKGYFVRHNLKFLPRKSHPDFDPAKDSNHSDIDVLGYNPRKKGADRIWAVSCKSWQGGFRPRQWLDAIEKKKKVSGRDAWKSFRELTNVKWSQGFADAIREATGASKFTYVVAVAKVADRDRDQWQRYKPFQKTMKQNPILIISFAEMVAEIQEQMRSKAGKMSKTLASSEVGRLLQLFDAAGLKLASPTAIRPVAARSAAKSLSTTKRSSSNGQQFGR